jgi:hypothetical protein
MAAALDNIVVSIKEGSIVLGPQDMKKLPAELRRRWKDRKFRRIASPGKL